MLPFIFPLWFDNCWNKPSRRRLMTLAVKGNWLAGIIPLQVTCPWSREWQRWGNLQPESVHVSYSVVLTVSCEEDSCWMSFIFTGMLLKYQPRWYFTSTVKYWWNGRDLGSNNQQDIHETKKSKSYNSSAASRHLMKASLLSSLSQQMIVVVV